MKAASCLLPRSQPRCQAHSTLSITRPKLLSSHCEAIRNELKDAGVTVTALMPGATETNFHRAGMDDTKVGAGEKDDPAEIAREGYEALMAGKDHVVAGSFKNKVQATMAHVIPDTFTAEMHRHQAELGSGKK